MVFLLGQRAAWIAPAVLIDRARRAVHLSICPLAENSTLNGRSRRDRFSPQSVCLADPLTSSKLLVNRAGVLRVALAFDLASGSFILILIA
jgi:hypothetical protein